ncbi:MAG: DUF2892 domain-containing protein [Thermoanaerobaculum sp.]|nr:DUF2892 domain-containing protein [Thermoanaerobaculum sp.]
MTTNMGSTDKTIRVLVGVAILGLGLYLKSWWGLVGLLPLITGLVGYCPAYRLLGISTCPKKP